MPDHPLRISQFCFLPQSFRHLSAHLSLSPLLPVEERLHFPEAHLCFPRCTAPSCSPLSPHLYKNARFLPEPHSHGYKGFPPCPEASSLPEVFPVRKAGSVFQGTLQDGFLLHYSRRYNGSGLQKTAPDRRFPQIPSHGRL